MNIGKLKIYILEVLLLLSLFFTLFVPNINKNILLAVILLLFSIIIKVAIKKRNILDYSKKEISIVMFIFALMYLSLFYLLGTFFGYNKTSTPFNINTTINFIIPIVLIIYSIEIIREILLAQKNKVSTLILFLSCIIIDLILYSDVYNIYKLDDFLIICGFIIFSSISFNLLYNYISSRYGKNSIIIFKIIIIIYPYIIPIVPNVYIFLKTFLRILAPYFIYLFIENTYAKTSFLVPQKDKAKEIITTTVLLLGLLSIVLLVSCNYKYGILVIGSGSMKNELNIGDATIFKKYSNDEIKVGDIIIFEKRNIKIIHRVVDIKNINGKQRYYTKGDANTRIDDEYVKEEEIIGISKVKLKYIGYPSIWLRNIFE